MGRFAAWIRAFALALGVPGLFIVALLDSSFLSLPEIADLLVVWMVTRHKALMPLLRVSATLGSLAGCLVSSTIGRKGGEALRPQALRAAPASSARWQRFRRYGVLAVLVPSILPPPAPFKIFVLLAGVADISVLRFSRWPSPSAAAAAIWCWDFSRSSTATGAMTYMQRARRLLASLVVVGVLAGRRGGLPAVDAKASAANRPTRSRMMTVVP